MDILGLNGRLPVVWVVAHLGGDEILQVEITGATSGSSVRAIIYTKVRYVCYIGLGAMRGELYRLHNSYSSSVRNTGR